ncbi:D-aminoacylase, C-terminal domain protein [Peptoniphilus sp. oral taxon 375 str. F0436]|nr:D-aminoacylase, C-terminal domain protein [Peptoniphilus sp. oral taxon 375 str. F0436]
MEEALYKSTLQPAKRLGLDHKLGRIKPGYQADLVLFDPEEIKDCADFEDGQRPPLGIKQVWVNGQLAVEDNKVINNRLGKSIRREMK